MKLFFSKMLLHVLKIKKNTILFLYERFFLLLDQIIFNINLYTCIRLFFKRNTVLQMSYLINQNKIRITCTDYFLSLDSK